MLFTAKRIAWLAPIAAALGAAIVVAAEVPWAFLRHPSSDSGTAWWFLGIVAGAALGGTARGLRALHRRHAALAMHVIVAACAAGLVYPTLAYLLPHRELPEQWSSAVADVLLTCAPLAVSLIALTWKRGLTMFALGAALATVLSWWYTSPAGPLAVLAFIFARDVGSVDESVPARQTFALAGVGALAVTFGLALAFDVAATTAHDPWACDWRSTIHLDAAILRWPRIILEAAMFAACCAHARGRTWGALALLVAAPVLLVPLVPTGFTLPYWGGCWKTAHPLEDQAVLFTLALGVAVAPYLSPIARRLRTR